VFDQEKKELLEKLGYQIDRRQIMPCIWPVKDMQKEKCVFEE
jgi:hypothetical protein